MTIKSGDLGHAGYSTLYFLEFSQSVSLHLVCEYSYGPCWNSKKYCISLPVPVLVVSTMAQVSLAPLWQLPP